MVKQSLASPPKMETLAALNAPVPQGVPTSVGEMLTQINLAQVCIRSITKAEDLLGAFPAPHHFDIIFFVPASKHQHSCRYVSQYIPTFEAEGMEMSVLVALARGQSKDALDDALKELGVKSVGHRLKIFAALQ